MSRAPSDKLENVFLRAALEGLGENAEVDEIEGHAEWSAGAGLVEVAHGHSPIPVARITDQGRDLAANRIAVEGVAPPITEKPMAGPSKIKRLPPDIRERLDERTDDESVTQREATEHVNELLAELYPDHPSVSKSALGRYDPAHAGGGRQDLGVPGVQGAVDHEARLAALQQGWADSDRDAQGPVLRSVAEDGHGRGDCRIHVGHGGPDQQARAYDAETREIGFRIGLPGAAGSRGGEPENGR